jgi:hypothetical protein
MLPKRKDLWAALFIFCAGMALGLAVNALSPKGFDFRMAAGLKQAFQPATDWDDDTPSAAAKPGDPPSPKASAGEQP